LLQNHPNTFNAITVISYQLSVTGGQQGRISCLYNYRSNLCFLGKNIFKHEDTKKAQRVMPKADPPLADTKEDQDNSYFLSSCPLCPLRAFVLSDLVQLAALGYVGKKDKDFDQ
jgi:hypothetical protein